MTIPGQNLPSSCIQPTPIGRNTEKVLGKKKVFVSIPIKISDRHTEDRRELCLQGKRMGLKSSRPIQKHHGFHPPRVQSLHTLDPIAQNLVNALGRVAGIGRKVLP